MGEHKNIYERAIEEEKQYFKELYPYQQYLGSAAEFVFNRLEKKIDKLKKENRQITLDLVYLKNNTKVG